MGRHVCASQWARRVCRDRSRDRPLWQSCGLAAARALDPSAPAFILEDCGTRSPCRGTDLRGDQREAQGAHRCGHRCGPGRVGDSPVARQRQRCSDWDRAFRGLGVGPSKTCWGLTGAGAWEGRRRVRVWFEAVCCLRGRPRLHSVVFEHLLYSGVIGLVLVLVMILTLLGTVLSGRTAPPSLPGCGCPCTRRQPWKRRFQLTFGALGYATVIAVSTPTCARVLVGWGSQAGAGARLHATGASGSGRLP